MLGRRFSHWLVGVSVSAVLTSCFAFNAWAASPAPPPAMSTKAPAKVEQVTSLEESTRPLEEYFNQTKNQARFLALLSPT